MFDSIFLERNKNCQNSRLAKGSLHKTADFRVKIRILQFKEIKEYHGKNTEPWHDRLWFYGEGAFQRLPQSESLLRSGISPGTEGNLWARREQKLKRLQDNWGYESVETDWRKLVERKDIDVDRCLYS